MSHSRAQRGPKAPFMSFFSCELPQLFILYACALEASRQQQQPTPSDDQQQQQQQASSSSSSRHARRRRAAAHTGGRSCRWHRRRGSYSRQSGETARREQCSNCKREYGLQNLRRGNWTYPSSSGGSPKHAERPPRHGARPLMHETPLAACDYRFGRGLRCSFGLPPEELG